MRDFSRASLATAACVDPWALSDQLEAGDPTSVRGMGAQFREASALAAEAASWGRKADDTMAAVYLNNGQSVFDAPASTAEGQTLLAENGDLMEEVARILVAVGDELEAAKTEARKQILALSADINETIERRSSYMSDNAAVLTPATAEAADQRFFVEAVER